MNRNRLIDQIQSEGRKGSYIKTCNKLFFKTSVNNIFSFCSILLRTSISKLDNGGETKIFEENDN